MKNRNNIFSLSSDQAHFRQINITHWNPDNVKCLEEEGKRKRGKVGKKGKQVAGLENILIVQNCFESSTVND